MQEPGRWEMGSQERKAGEERKPGTGQTSGRSKSALGGDGPQRLGHGTDRRCPHIRVEDS